MILGQKRFEGKLYSWRLAYFDRISPSDVFVSWKIGQHPKADFVSKIPCESNHATVSDELNLVFAFGILTLHHFFFSAMYLKIVSAKQHACCWAFVLSEILIKDLSQKHTSYFHIPRRDGHAHRPDCQSLQDGRLRGREDLRTSGEVHLQGQSWLGNGMRWWDDKLPIDCDNIMVRLWPWYDSDSDRSWMRVGFGRYCADSPCYFCAGNEIDFHTFWRRRKRQTSYPEPWVGAFRIWNALSSKSNFRNVFGGDVQIETSTAPDWKDNESSDQAGESAQGLGLLVTFL